MVVSYLLLPYPNHIIIIAWTLSIELLFYGLFAATYFGGGPRRLILAMVLWTVASQILMQFFVNTPGWISLILHSAVLEFLLGIFIAILFAASPEFLKKYRLFGLVLGLAGVGFYLFTGGWELEPFGREISAGIPAAFLVFGTIGYSFSFAEKLEVWGESSYILYLFHILYFSISAKVIELTIGVNLYHSAVGMLALLISVVAISCVATVWIERPYQKWYRARLSGNTG
jgi:peptidoglycan/LPS O-acetylase OafA/YrhL